MVSETERITRSENQIISPLSSVDGPTRVILDTPSRANLLAVCLYQLLLRARRPLPAGTVMIISDGMTARIINDANPRVMSRDGPADCTIEGGLGVLLKVLTHQGRLLPGSIVRLRLRGNPLKGWALLRAIRC